MLGAGRGGGLRPGGPGAGPVLGAGRGVCVRADRGRGLCWGVVWAWPEAGS